MTVPYIFATQIGNISLSELDVNFANVKASADTAATVTTSSQPNITSVGTLSALNVNGDINATVVNGNTVNALALIVESSSDFNNNVIGNVASPVAGSDVATKMYVDNTVSAGGFDITDGVTTETVNTGDTISFEGDTNITVTVDVVGNTESNIAVSLNNDVSLSGNITAANITGAYILGNGSQLTGLPATYTNSDVATYLASGTVTSDILTSGQISAGGNVQGTFIFGDGGFLSNVTATSNLAVTQIQSGTTLLRIDSVDGNIVMDVDGATDLMMFKPVGLELTGNANITGNVNATGTVSATGQITGSQFNGSGAGLTSIAAGNIVGSVANAIYADDAGNVATASYAGNAGYADSAGSAAVSTSADTAATVTTAAQPNITSVGTLSVLNVNGTISASGAVSASGNVQVGNVRTSGIVSAAGNITGANILTNGLFSAAGAITAGGFTTSGNISSGNISSINVNSSGTITAIGTITGGNIATAGTVSATGQITGSQFNGSGAGLTSIPAGNITGTVASASSADTATTAGTVTTAAQPNITSVGTLSSVSVSGNVQGGNLRTAGAVSATGQVTGSQFNGSGAGLNSIPGANVIGTLSINTTGYAATVSDAAQANITSVGTLSSLAVTGNVQGGNLRTTGLISATGTVTGTSFIGVSTSAQYADVAENYIADSHYEPGTVLEFGGNDEVTMASVESDRIAGVVSTKPAYLMNSELTGKHVVALALLGRVPVKVTGIVKKGDMLVSAGNGVAQAKQRPETGTIIGKAVQDSTGDSIIEVVVGRL